MNVSRSYEGLSKEKIRESFTTFGACGVPTFQGAYMGVTVQFINKHVLFMIGVHCMAHRINLAVRTFSDFEAVIDVEDMLALVKTMPKKTLAIIGCGSFDQPSM